MKTNILSVLPFIFFGLQTKGQVNQSELPLSVKFDGSAPHPSALLEVKSIQKGLLVAPADAQFVERMDDLPEGAMYFDSLGCLHVYQKEGWRINCGLHAKTSTDPTAPGQIPVQNADGTFQWKSLQQLQEESIEYHQRAFQAIATNFYALPLTGEIPLDAELDNDQTFFSGNSDHHFIATEEGYYYITSTISFKDGNGVDDTIFMRIYVNNQVTHIESLIDPKYFANGGHQSQSLSGILYLAKRDKVKVRLDDVNQSISIIDRSLSGQKISN